MKKQQFDLIIIGAGSGGLSLAAGAAQLGLNVALLEKNRMGGDCLNYGCVPSKALLAAAKSVLNAHHAKNFGIETPVKKINFNQVMAHVHQVISEIAVHDSVERFSNLGVKVFQEAGSFVDGSTVAAGDHLLQASYITIATGSQAAIPPIPGLNEINFLTNETIFSLTELPEHLIIIGAGPIGCELAQAFALLGTRVSLLEAGAILRNDDKECVEIVRQSLLETGVELHEAVVIHEIKKETTNDFRLLCTKETKELSLVGSHILVATGRKPAIDGLDCDKAGVHFNPRGIMVNNRLRTTNHRIFAIGDVVGQLQFTHVANYHAGVVLKNIVFKIPAKINNPVIPWVTFTNPELAQVGIKESDPQFDAKKMQVLRCPYSNNDRAQTELVTNGMIKIIVNRKGIVLGATIVGAEAGELILPWCIAIKEKRSLRLFTDLIIAYPSLSELSKRVASQFYTPKLFSAKVRRLVRFLHTVSKILSPKH